MPGSTTPKEGTEHWGDGWKQGRSVRFREKGPIGIAWNLRLQRYLSNITCVAHVYLAEGRGGRSYSEQDCWKKHFFTRLSDKKWSNDDLSICLLFYLRGIREVTLDMF